MASTQTATVATTMQLEFAQAMADFKTMFPDMDKEVIEAVLRSNQGAVDATIDQLLTMSTDNQNEKLRNELEKPRASSSSSKSTLATTSTSTAIAGPSTGKIIDFEDDPEDCGQIRLLSSTPLSPQAIRPDAPAAAAAAGSHTGALPKTPKQSGQQQQRQQQKQQPQPSANNDSDIIDSIMRCDDVEFGGDEQPQPQPVARWRPAMLRPLPPGFLRLNNELSLFSRATSTSGSGPVAEFDIPDEQFALMLQNEEFMNELRWNPEFMCALEKEQHQHQQKHSGHPKSACGCEKPGGGGGGGGELREFRERLRHMGKRSRKKFATLARVFTWQRNKKPGGAVRHPDSLPLREEHSDDDEHNHHQQQQHQQQQAPGGADRVRH